MTSRGIPTTYRGARFRSRLEARWAAMFDLLGWKWTYEPFDADGYIPDFVIQGPEPLLIEIKPDTTPHELGRHLGKVRISLQRCWDHRILIAGSQITMGPGYVGEVAMIVLDDSCGEGYDVVEWAMVWRKIAPDTEELGFGLSLNNYHPTIGLTDDVIGELPSSMYSELQELWNRAGSSVQWHPAPW